MALSPPFVFKRIGFGAVILVIWLFLYTQADWLYGTASAELARNTLLLYFIMFLLASAIFAKGIPGSKKGFGEVMGPFILAFIVTTVIVGPIILILSVIVPQATISIFQLALAYGLLHAFVIAYIEELVFRYYLPLEAGLGDYISIALFGFFHLNVLLFSGVQNILFPLLLLIVMGGVWTMVRRWFSGPKNVNIAAGLAASTGSHFAYNLVILGIWFTPFMVV